MEQIKVSGNNKQQMNYKADEIDLLDLARFLLRKIGFLIAACFVGAIVAGLVTKFAITPLYTATAKMYMVSSSTGSVVDLTDLNIGTSLSADYTELIKTRPIVEDVIEDLNLKYKYEELLKMTDISVVGNTRIITISVTSPSPQEAADVANALAKKAKEELPELMETPAPSIAEEAIVPKKKSSPSLTKNVAMGGLLLTVLVGAFFVAMYLMDDTLKTAEDIEKEFGIMPLTVIPGGDYEGVSDKEEDKKRKKKRNKK